MKTMTKFALTALLFTVTPTALMAADYSSMSTDDLAAQRGTMQQATVEDRSAFQQEWQSRVQQMSVEQKQQYTGLPASAPQDGSGRQYRSNGGQSGQSSTGMSGGAGNRGGGRGGRR